LLEADRVHETIARSQLADGLAVVPDLDGSHGCWMRDAVSGEDYLDAFTCFASWPIGYNHPALLEEGYRADLLRAASAKLSNSDLYTREMAEFVRAFDEHVTPPEYPHHFWVSGGALAVENALKAAFDWKARKLGRTNYEGDCNDLVILHFKQAFHGRSGYTMSLTNTDPKKTGLYPKFSWPRAHNPAIEFGATGEIVNDIEAEERRAKADIERAFAEHGRKIAAIIIEPMQGEGGDNHFRPEFLASLRAYADEEEALLIFDEVQTGFYGSGSAWLWQKLGVAPDIVAFGKKTQVCGIYANARLDEVAGNVFQTPGRINSTWGGNLVDMVRCRRFIGVIERERLGERTTRVGAAAVEGLREMACETGAFGNVRGVGSLVAFTFPEAPVRDRVLGGLFEQRVLALPSGETSVRFRLPLVMTEAELDELLARTGRAVGGVAAGQAV